MWQASLAMIDHNIEQLDESRPELVSINFTINTVLIEDILSHELLYATPYIRNRQL